MANKTHKINHGTVVYNLDPNYSGRVKVRIHGINDNVPINQLPWVTYGGGTSANGGSVSIPKVGTQVRIKFKNFNDVNSIEWTGTIKPNKKMCQELAEDYEGSHVLLFDDDSNVKLKFQPHIGLEVFYGGSYIHILPGGTIMIHYGLENSGTDIQLSFTGIDINASQNININSESINLNANNITVNGKNVVSIKGTNTDAGNVAVNGNELLTLLQSLAGLIDQKIPTSGGQAMAAVNGSKALILNENIHYI